MHWSVVHNNCHHMSGMILQQILRDMMMCQTMSLDGYHAVG
jgi:hypothetical protein